MPVSADGCASVFRGFLANSGTPAFISGVLLNIQYAKKSHAMSASIGTPYQKYFKC